jgi:hypothetical protein
MYSHGSAFNGLLPSLRLVLSLVYRGTNYDMTVSISTFTMAGASTCLRVLLVVFTVQLCFGQSSASSKVASIATDPSPSPTVFDQSSSTSSAPSQTHTIQVGLADHKFRPDTVQAEIGDVSIPIPSKSLHEPGTNTIHRQSSSPSTPQTTASSVQPTTRPASPTK